MHILVTGGGGFLGTRLVRRLLGAGEVVLNGKPPHAINRITITDLKAPAADIVADQRVHLVEGDLVDLLTEGRLLTADAPVDAIFHLASAVSAECEADFDLGMRSNLEGIQRLLDHCRRSQIRPLVVFSSSLAVFGHHPAVTLPDSIEDTTLPTPQSSYGIQKFIGEQLVADYSRKRFIVGRNVRLMTVSVRPGKPNGAASSFLSGIIREPLSGERSVCPVPADTPVALASPTAAVDALLMAAAASEEAWGAPIALNMPALTVTVGQMVAALEATAGSEVVDLIDWQEDLEIKTIVSSWPSKINSERAIKLGLRPDRSFEDLIKAYISENLDGFSTD